MDKQDSKLVLGSRTMGGLVLVASSWGRFEQSVWWMASKDRREKEFEEKKIMLSCGSKKGQNADSHRGKEVRILMKSESFHVFIRSGWKVQNVKEMIVC